MILPASSKTSYGVYRIVAPSGSCYIGMTMGSFTTRWNEHLKRHRLGTHHCKGLSRAFAKYGVEAMSFEILEDMTDCNQEEVLYRERLWWLRHKAWGVNLYNGEPSGQGSVFHTEETRKKMSLTQKLEPNKFCPTCKAPIGTKSTTRRFCSKKCLRTWNQAERNKYYSSIENHFKKLYLVDLMSIEDLSTQFHLKQRAIYYLIAHFDLPTPRYR